MIRCEGLTAGYGKKSIIRDICWEPAEGKLTAVVGPNGCGKTTLLRSLIGRTETENGSVCLDGKPIGQWKSRDIARRLAYLPQNRNDVNLSVFRMALHGRFPHLAYPRHYTSDDEKMVIEASERMGISRLLDQPVSELSGGEKQRVYLAMALVQDAPIMLLDEPTTYLDISAQMDMLEILRGLSDTGRTVIVVLHDLDQALRYAEHIALMEAGRLRRCGSPEEMLESGALEEVFHIRIHALRDGDGGSHYCFSPCSSAR